ncbi:hypothetical protein [Ornithinicoccus hortensis]|uniref:Uncharacterized protein n=1 Tax=Ornithinicoccus hortensis TaxID=82346 RepID=A0A542YNM9_9MICO|nr:hypothetical protein [Ornithinicoccus hortensis]TQL49700.1 hypothetical protein FB467_0787 [Ornithinicoccus hortensis]
MPLRPRLAAVSALVVVSVTACAGQGPSDDREEATGVAVGSGSDAAGASGPGDESRSQDATRTTGTAPARSGTPSGAVLFLVPDTATHVTITDFDAIRERLGVPEMTSEWLMTDRIEFWGQVSQSTVLLTDGALREENSRFMLRYGFTQDDVDWEARWTGDAPGLALGLRPDLDPDGVERAVADGVGPLAGAHLEQEESVVVSGGATGGDATIAADPAVVRLAGTDAESLYLRRGCIPFHEALGVDATEEDQDEVVADHDVPGLLRVEGIAVAFTGRSATVRLAYPEGVTEEAAMVDLGARADLAADWPLVESITFADGFVVEPPPPVGFADGVGELTYPVAAPGGAATLTLTGLLPVGVCNEVPPMEEPTGLTPGG